MKVSGIRTLIAVFILNLYSLSYSQIQSGSPASQTTVYIFLSETCPICQSYTLPLKMLQAKFPGIDFIGIFPNYYSDKKSISEFQKEYSVPFKLIKDENSELTKKFNATITPEVFVVRNDTVIYSGRIDDSFYAIGKRRNVISSSELNETLELISSDKEIKTFKTQAVGCIINGTK